MAGKRERPERQKPEGVGDDVQQAIERIERQRDGSVDAERRGKLVDTIMRLILRIETGDAQRPLLRTQLIETTELYADLLKG